MTEKSDFDWWINRDRDTCNVPCDEPIPGTTSAIREQLWFRWASPSELRDKVIEIVACYPNRSLESENEDRLEAIWDRAASVLSEQVSVEHDDVPQFVRDGFVEELRRTEHQVEHDASRRTLRWQHPAGFRCFLNQGAPEWSASRWRAAVDIEGLLQAPTAVECRVLQRIAQECGNQPLSDAIKAAYTLSVDNADEAAASVVHLQGAQTAAQKIDRQLRHLTDRTKGAAWSEDDCIAVLNVWRQRALTATNPTKTLAAEIGYSERTVSEKKSIGEKIERQRRNKGLQATLSVGPILANMGQIRRK